MTSLSPLMPGRLFVFIFFSNNRAFRYTVASSLHTSKFEVREFVASGFSSCYFLEGESEVAAAAEEAALAADGAGRG
jgi:hypothetical protein